jgi:phosphotransferase system enzyme I (PtsI)
VSAGIGYGPVRRLTKRVPEPPAGERHGGDAAAERERARDALERVAADLGERGVAATSTEGADVLAAQAMMARDPALIVMAEELIDEGSTAARAVYESFGRFREALVRAGGYLAERAADLDDVRDRVVAVLTGRPIEERPAEAGERPYVLMARDLAPADTATLTREIVAAFVTEEGGPTSHTAILARAMGVPAVVACPGAAEVAEGTRVLVDGSRGVVHLAPERHEVAEARRRMARREKVLSAAWGPGATADGHRVPLLANIGSPGDVEAAVENGAEGVGLFRTEFLFLGRGDAPGVAEQETAYRRVLEAFPGGRVVVRVLDAGADKPLAFLPADAQEPNPALGRRGARVFRTFPEILTTQLAALARAAQSAAQPADLWVMAPMIAGAEEAAWFADACREAGLTAPGPGGSGRAGGRAMIGVMIEIPSAALRAREVAACADFLSIGTNDLAQYAFAADRQLGSLTAYQDPWQPALLDLVAMAGSAGRPCGVCGEAAADPGLACVLVGLGVTSLSMAAPAIPTVRAALAAHTLAQCRAAAGAARAASTADEAKRAAHAALPGLADL